VIAERLRDGLADFSQLRPWFDANDLPAGASWAGRMDEAARAATDGLIAVITDAYHTRYWCQREAHHAREPRRLEVGLPLWGVQPTVALLSTAGGAQRVVPALSGVLHIGWRGPDAIAEAAAKTSAVATLSVREAEADAAAETIEDVVEWWLLEALLARVAERRARDVWEAEGPAHDGLALLTFTPDPYTLGRLLGAWRRAQKGQLPKHIGYPGFGLPVAGRERLIEVLLDHGYSDTAARACLVPLLEMVGPAALAAPSPASTPRGGRAGAQGAVAQRPPAGLRVALSAGGTEAELAEVGLGAVHIDDLQVRVSRALLAAGHRLAFGGTFDPGPAAVAGAPRAGGVNLTARLLQLAQGWAAAQADADVHAADAKRGPATGLLDRLKEPPLLNYARWTAAGAPDTAARAARAGACMFIDVLPAGRSAAELAAWVAERAARAAPLPAGASVEQVAEHREARAAVEGKILWAEREALTAMRRRSAQDCGARVLMGGKIHGAAGWLPGVAEELEVSLWAHDPNGAGDPAAWSPAFAQPVLLLGGFGGVSGLLAGFLREADAAWPALPAGSGGAGGADTFEAERCGRWERLEALMRGFRAHLHGLEGGEAVFPADPWTHTTLTKTTFLKLLKVDSPTAALRLVRRVFGA
jgi:hypothetical protein